MCANLERSEPQAERTQSGDVSHTDTQNAIATLALKNAAMQNKTPRYAGIGTDNMYRWVDVLAFSDGRGQADRQLPGGVCEVDWVLLLA